MSIDKSYNEIIAALEAGQTPLLFTYRNNRLAEVLKFETMRHISRSEVEMYDMISFSTTTISPTSVSQLVIVISSESPNVGQVSYVTYNGSGSGATA